MYAALSALAAGLVSGLGLIVSGMSDPAKVLNFLDVAGTWDPSLAFVMGGALVVAAVGYRFILKRPAPLFAASFSIPTRSDIDAPLIAGAAIFRPWLGPWRLLPSAGPDVLAPRGYRHTGVRAGDACRHVGRQDGQGRPNHPANQLRQRR